ncbi:hypothetical protein ACE41H_12870 [Paenibacillus enshidis]|uniref:DUF502 domain-containing protein n=1 Tax=Paenibacillus enshidis TaxID=1458439 RepID=A0ABV5ATX7_9BACL
MESLLSTIVFILPGFMLYLWIQLIGVNPVAKHTTAEFAAIAALAWIPVIITTVWIMSFFKEAIWTLDGLLKASGSLIFIGQFFGISLATSFLIACIYAWVFYPTQRFLVNLIRLSVGKAGLSKSASVWEEIFLGSEKQVVGIAKIGSITPDIIGAVEKVARPFETKIAFGLLYIEHCKMIVEKYEVPISQVFTDIDSGVHVIIYDIEEYEKADQKFRESEESTTEESTDSHEVSIS